MEMSFNVSGEYITNLARDWFYFERRPFDKIKELLLSCMSGTDISLDTLNQYVEDILKFKKKFIGETKDNTFCLVEDDDNEKDKFVKYYEYIKKYGKIPFEICEYGFINPEGTYIPVAWCKHSKWARDYINENYSIEEQLKIRDDTDWLVKVKNWILIDNPHQGQGIVQRGEKITKSQKETLFDYYMFFDRKKEASKLYEEDYEEEI